MATIIPTLDTAPNSLSSNQITTSSEEVTEDDITDDITDEAQLGWGPKTTDPGPEQVYPSEKLCEVIDVDPSLNPSQRNAMYEVVERNQATFGFDGCLGHLRAKVHIRLLPDTKPITMPPYYASPAKREAIDKQIDLWLSQGIIEESKSPWGAPMIIVYRNDKPRVCIDY